MQLPISPVKGEPPERISSPWELILQPIAHCRIPPPNKLRVRDWLHDIGIVSLNTYFDPKLDLEKKFKLIGMPTTVLLDKAGNEFGRIMGEFDFNDESFKDLLKNKINL